MDSHREKHHQNYDPGDEDDPLFVPIMMPIICTVAPPAFLLLPDNPVSNLLLFLLGIAAASTFLSWIFQIFEGDQK